MSHGALRRTCLRGVRSDPIGAQKASFFFASFESVRYSSNTLRTSSYVLPPSIWQMLYVAKASPEAA